MSTFTALQAAKSRHQTKLEEMFPGVVTIASINYDAACTLGTVQVETPRGGYVEKRSLNARISKEKMVDAPVLGTVIKHEDFSYKINEVTGRASHAVHWYLQCVEPF